ncbi:MAG TPA: hypothetical protein VFA23_06905 [Dongiaceae bacterium]|nr:hypothetical protein [Dongiaceae bacterium]
MAQDLQQRIERMFRRDRLWASGFVLVLWAVVLFVMLAVRPHIPHGSIETVCWIAALVLVLFNTASITAMIRHYADDKTHIYSVDIRHLDAGR